MKQNPEQLTEARGSTTSPQKELLVALKQLLRAIPDCEGDYFVNARGDYILKHVGIGAACRDARAAIAKAERQGEQS